MSDELLSQIKAMQREIERLKAFDVLDGTPWRNWVPIFPFGFSVDPLGGIYRYCRFGKLCHVAVEMPNTGTSDSIYFTMTLPIISAVIAGMDWRAPILFAKDNGIVVATVGVAVIGSGDSVATLYTDHTGAGWTNSGDKSASFEIAYEVG